MQDVSTEQWQLIIDNGQLTIDNAQPVPLGLVTASASRVSEKNRIAAFSTTPDRRLRARRSLSIVNYQLSIASLHQAACEVHGTACSDQRDDYYENRCRRREKGRIADAVEDEDSGDDHEERHADRVEHG